MSAARLCLNCGNYRDIENFRKFYAEFCDICLDDQEKEPDQTSTEIINQDPVI